MRHLFLPKKADSVQDGEVLPSPACLKTKRNLLRRLCHDVDGADDATLLFLTLDAPTSHLARNRLVYLLRNGVVWCSIDLLSESIIREFVRVGSVHSNEL